MAVEAKQKAAVLLQALGDDVSQAALDSLESERAENLRRQLTELKASPVSTEEAEAVIAEFERFFKFALKAAGAESFWSRFADENPELMIRDMDDDDADDGEEADEDEDDDGAGDRSARRRSSKEKGGSGRRRAGIGRGQDGEEDEEPGSNRSRRKKNKAGGGAVGDDDGSEDPQSGAELDDEELEGDEDQPQFRIFQPTDDAFADLRRLHPQQIAGALKQEQPKIVALVLGCLPESQAAEVMELVPDDKQNQVFDMLLAGTSAPESLLDRIVQATVIRGLAIDKPEVKEPEPDEKVAGLLRALPRDLRGKMMEHLSEADPEKAQAMQSLLYLFDDLLRYTDRSIQKVLAEVDKVALTNALQGAGDEIRAKLLNNLSKRARETLLEELEFAQKQPEQVVTDARKSITEVLAKLDAADQVELEE